MNPEPGSLMRVVAHSALTSGFSTQRSVPGFKLINNNCADGQNDYCLGRLRVQNMFLRYGLN